MKKILVTTSLLSLVTGGIAFAASPAIIAADANQITAYGNDVATMTTIDARRNIIAASVRTELQAMNADALNLMNAPIATLDERAAVSNQIEMLSGRIEALSGLIQGLNQIRSGEISLLVSIGNGLENMFARL